ncbi:subtilisin-like protease SBT1.2 [Asparagus officinalis]|uniref:subtilisin-like protease SBT1.2 n=1 Tax=Asparagus officinalis TaxID=4686 RepID=UPI00098E7CA4|nr:subtilisin-like protease SBT1.2 [Asparagus officinalis]
MESIDGFVHAQPDDRLSLATTYSPKFLGFSRWEEDGLWVDSSYGQGVIIGVIDGGIDPAHPSFNDNGSIPPPPAKWKGKCGFRQPSSCNKKLIGAISFRGGCRPPPVANKRHGHGTHVASIAAGGMVPDAHGLGQAEGVASGIAPHAHISVYKVCFREECTATDVLAGIDQAISDGVDILSISINHPRIVPMYNDVIAIGSLAAIKKGILPCLPAGNFGPYKSIILNDAPWILTVGASTMDRRITVTVKLGNGMEIEGESAYQPRNFTSKMLPLVFPGYKNQEHRSCNNASFDSLNLRGKVVACKAEGIKNIEMGKFVAKAGGVAMVVMNPFYLGSTTFSEPHFLPSAHLRYADAMKVLSYLESNSTPTATIEFDGTNFGARPSPAVATFSSRGPSLINGGILKPDVIAPGANILSSWPTSSSSSAFNFLSGTSIATPHIAGIAALLRKNHPKWSPAAIKSAIMTTADRKDLEGNPIADEYNMCKGSVFALGSGQVNPSAANDPGLVYDIQPRQYYTRYLCSLGFTSKQLKVIAQHQVDCAGVIDTGAGELNYPSISVHLKPGQKKIVSRTVTNVGEANEVYSVQIEEPEGVRVNVSPNRLHFYEIGRKKRFSVEFSIKGVPQTKGQISEGQLMWISGKHVVRSPIAVTFI